MHLYKMECGSLLGHAEGISRLKRDSNGFEMRIATCILYSYVLTEPLFESAEQRLDINIIALTIRSNLAQRCLEGYEGALIGCGSMCALI